MLFLLLLLLLLLFRVLPERQRGRQARRRHLERQGGLAFHLALIVTTRG